MSTGAVSIQTQAVEVRNVALGLRAQAERPEFRKRHEKTGGLERQARVVAALFAAADTLDRLVEAEKRRAAKA